MLLLLQQQQILQLLLLQPQLQLYTPTLHYITLHYTHCTTPQLQLQLQLHYTTLITPHHNYNCNCNCTTLISLQLQLHHATLQVRLQLHYTRLHPAVVVRWPLRPLQPAQKTQLQPPLGPSVDSLCHPWFTTTNPSYRFPISETSAAALCGTTGKTSTFLMVYTTYKNGDLGDCLWHYLFGTCGMVTQPPSDVG